jgi:Bacterial mobilisation protein (MobC)
MAAATYVSVLLRSHLRGLTPLPKEELAALKLAVSELSAVGRNLNQIARAANEGARIGGGGREEFKAMIKLCEAMRDHIKNLVKANATSWTSGHAAPAD